MFRARITVPEPIVNCPVLVYLIWSTGRHTTIWVDCGRWRCVKCGEHKLQEIAINLADATVNDELLYHETTKEEQHDAVRRSLQRKKCPSLKIRFHDGTHYVVTNQPLSGRGWSFEQAEKIDVLTHILNEVDHLTVQRHTYTLHWKPEEKFENQTATAIYRLHVSNHNDIEQKLAEIDHNLSEEYLLKPYEVAQLLRDKYG